MSDHLVSLKRTKKDRSNSDEAMPVGEGDLFPYGTSISLDNETLDKLDMKKLPAVGETLIVAAIGRVTSVSERDNKRGKSRDVNIQLEQLAIGPLKSGKVATSEDAITDAIKGL